MLPVCILDIICDYVLGLRMVHLNREVREARQKKIRNASKEQLSTNGYVWAEWIDSRDKRGTWAPFENYIQYVDWMNEQPWWVEFQYWHALPFH